MQPIIATAFPRRIETVNMIIFSPSEGSPTAVGGCKGWYSPAPHKPFPINFYYAMQSIQVMNFHDFDVLTIASFSTTDPGTGPGNVTYPAPSIATRMEWIDTNGASVKDIINVTYTPLTYAPASFPPTDTMTFRTRYMIAAGGFWESTDPIGTVCGIKYTMTATNCTATLDLVADPLIIRCLGNDFEDN